MLDPTQLAAWTAQLSRLILRWMSTYGVPVTRDERWQMARNLHPHVERIRRQAYEQTSAQLREQGLRPAPMRQYRPSALVSAIERATGAEPPAQARRARPEDRGVQPAEDRRSAPARQTPPAPAEQPAAPTAERPAPVQRPAPAEESRREDRAEPAPEAPRQTSSRARVSVTPTPAEPQRPRSRVSVTAPEQQAGPRVRVNDLDPESRRQARSRVEVTGENRSEPTVVRAVTDRVAATVERHVRNVDRDTVVATANAAGDEIGWARVLSGGENCPFCAMLASRGPVYRSDKSALTVVGDRRGRARGSRAVGESYHDHCDCSAVLVREGQDWDGREEFERLERMWVAASAAHPRDTTRAFNRAWRRIQREPALEDDYTRLWEESTQGLEGSAALRAFGQAAAENPPEALDASRRSPSRRGDDPPADPEPTTPDPGPDDNPPPGPPGSGDAGPAAGDQDPFDGLPFPHPWTVSQDLGSLSAEERNELRHYAVGGYRDVNDAMRGRREMTPDLERRIDLLRSAIDARPLTRTYRVTRTAETADLGLDGRTIDESLIGEWLREPAFMSTSGHRNPPYLMNRANPVILDLIVPEGTPGVAIDDSLTTQEMVEKERELLLTDGVRILIIGVRYDDERQAPRLQGRVVHESRRDS
ncbi:VG15 protein [Nocardia thailandica]|uniref:VG15 protein n=1 Tax=Nocardia thailandica TaxID=257275 RepID=UPI000307DBE0|nr:ADP-ribosyltransferase [Nocardia thailandica]